MLTPIPPLPKKQTNLPNSPFQNGKIEWTTLPRLPSGAISFQERLSSS
jgi:hypothetical protein